ncbi:hypothetical protein ZTR_03265 [Talaromyces verruculosus]|nr:hypothetical protein ZTR_03265 [Talaromyces verruculosus]
MSVNEYKYDWIAGAESLEKYRPGGYHPVMIGADAHPSETSVLKVLSPPSSSPHPGQKSIPLPLDEFQVDGPNGIHKCYTMTPARCNLREVSFSHLFPLEVARALSGGLAMAVAYTHSRGFDQFSIEELYEEYAEPETVTITERNKQPLPANIPTKAVLRLYLGKDAEEFSLSDAQVLLSDFGEAFSPGHTERLGQDCHTPLAMQPPEARFAPHEFATADDIFAQQIDVLSASSLPSEWWEAWEQRSNFLSSSSENKKTKVPKEGRYVWPLLEQACEEGVQKYRRRTQKVKEFDEEEIAAILTLMRRMLVFRPEDRLTAEEVLQSEWMVKWALPEFYKTLEMI